MDETHFTVSNEKTRNVGVAQGVLTSFPTRKGYDTRVGETPLSWLLSQYEGKNVIITIQELVEYQSSEQSPNQKVRVDE